MNHDIKQLIGELSNEEKLELKKFRMEYLKKLMIDKLTQASGVETAHLPLPSISTTTENGSFKKVFLYIPTSFKIKITNLKAGTRTTATGIVRDKIDEFFKSSNTDDFKRILDIYQAYFSHNNDSKVNLACSIESTKIHLIDKLSKEFKLSNRWIIEAILYNQTNY